jgi:hypothetical protein
MRLLFGARRSTALVLALVIAVPLFGHADEGFWLFNRVPREAIKKAYGVALPDEWLQRVQEASVSFGGGSGSFVSSEGLVLTNHHVAMSFIEKLSTTERDYVKNGFVARDRAQELKIPDIELAVQRSISDVTAQVNRGVKPGTPPAAALAARRAAIAAIEKEALAKTGLQSKVVTLYQGALYHLYQYEEFTDIRLVFAPEFDAAFYGGDPDNFTFPRYALDMALVRVYENGKPLTVKHFLPWSPDGTKEGDPVFTSGHAGGTQRLNTVAHLEFVRDHSLPFNLEVHRRIRDALDEYRKQGPDAEREARDLFFGFENSLKSWRGQLQGLRDPALMSKKSQAEQSLRDAVMTRPDLKTRFGDAWDAVAAARRALLSYHIERALLENGLGLYSDYFFIARTLVRWAEESQRPNGERLPEYTDARKPALERQMASTTPISLGLEKARLAESLSIIRDKLGADHPAVTVALDGKSPDERAADLVTRTRLGDPTVRKSLFAGGAAAIQASDDPFIEIARAIEPQARALRTRTDNEVVAVERDAYAKIAQAMFATQGDAAYPDGTFTLRLSYGTVKGYQEDGKTIAPYTDFRGLYARADQHGMKPPYRYPESWARARTMLQLNTPFNLVTTNDIVGGNSGSPLINASGALVGVIFDGNIQSLPGYFVYDGTVNRAVSVDVRGMIEAMRKVYHAEALVSELLAARAAPTAR